MKRIVRRLLLSLALATVVGAVGLDQAVGQDKKKADAAGAVFEVYKDRQNDYRFRLKDGDVLLAISGKGYKTKADCLKVIDTIKTTAAKAKVKEVETKK